MTAITLLILRYAGFIYVLPPIWVLRRRLSSLEVLFLSSFVLEVAPFLASLKVLSVVIRSYLLGVWLLKDELRWGASVGRRLKSTSHVMQALMREVRGDPFRGDSFAVTGGV